ncbi:MAG: MBL fold metallo-hydrolase [Myxococcales bacterium]|nr:MBL fold metallo-hydrolase [Myxococcales bacterium]MCB9717780.1 MBL fold metallo-hydrolase [Myxococcales bacterium]
MHFRAKFLGAAGTVTGSKTLVEAGNHRVLVDCGLFQGLKALRARNRGPTPLEIEKLDSIVLTHAHIDHSGYLPLLSKRGYRGPVYCTEGTRDLLQILLPDSGHLQEEEARHAIKWGWSKHRVPAPLYTRADAERSLALLRTVPFDEPVEVAPGVKAQLGRAGHIVGSSFVRLEHAGRSLTFTGDVGRPLDPIMKPPAMLLPTDHLVIESTYGDRRHPHTDALDELEAVLTRTFARGGTVLVPAFAVGRTQHLLHLIADLFEQGRVPRVPVYLDSPMAIAATQIFFDNGIDQRLDAEQLRAMDDVASYANTPDQSKAIDMRSGPMVVISASGMATGGRVLHHLVRFLPAKENTVLLVGFQAAGTRGRTLEDGVDEVKVFGQYVTVGAEIAKIEVLSAHADWMELVQWLEQSKVEPRRVWVNHGEPGAADAFRRRLRDHFGWEVEVAQDGETVDLR